MSSQIHSPKKYRLAALIASVAWCFVFFLLFANRDKSFRQRFEGLNLRSELRNDTRVPDLRFEDATVNFGFSDYKFKLPDLMKDYSKDLEKNEAHLRGEYILGPGVAIADFNNDGYMDVFLPAGGYPGKNHLFINQGGNHFVDRAFEWGISDINSNQIAALSPVVFDFNGDHLPDLFVAGLGCTRLYENRGDHFVDATEVSGLKDCKNSQGAVVVDFNHDGLPDLFVFRYFPNFNFLDPKAFIWPENTYSANNGGQDSLYLNLGNGKFKDMTDQVLPPATGWAIDANYGDMRNQGKMDLYVANDFGPDFLFEEDGSKFVNRSGDLGVPDRRYGMNVSFVDLDGSGTPHIFISNVFYPRYNERGNFLWHFDQNGKATDRAPEYGLENCLFAWGAAFGDFNLDGHIDSYVANGFVSRDKPWTSGDGFVTATFVGLPGIMTSHLSLFEREKIPFRSGNQVDCVFVNQGAKFKNESYRSGIRKSWDGRAVAMIDTKNNGVLDLVVTTRTGEVHFLKNQIAPSQKWIGLKINHKPGLSISAGTKIEIVQDGFKAYRWDTSGKSGFIAYSDPRIHFGLPNEGPVSINILWPLGKKTHLSNLAPGKYYSVNEE